MPSATAPQSSTVAAEDVFEMIYARNKAIQDQKSKVFRLKSSQSRSSQHELPDERSAYEEKITATKMKRNASQRAFRASPKSKSLARARMDKYHAKPGSKAKMKASMAKYLAKPETKAKRYCNEHMCQKRTCTDCMSTQEAIDKGLVCLICREKKTRHAMCDDCRGTCRGSEPLRIEAIVG